MEDELFDVYQFFTTGEYEQVRENVTAHEAFAAVKHYTANVAVKMGIIERVIITDKGDFCVFEWKKDLGVTWPKRDTTGKYV